MFYNKSNKEKFSLITPQKPSSNGHSKRHHLDRVWL